jgi:hypothetical protein
MDGRELIWSSHRVPHDIGLLFTRDHEIFSYLQVRFDSTSTGLSIGAKTPSARERHWSTSLRQLRGMGKSCP